MPAPLLIASLAQLACHCASHKDFELKVPDGGFKRILRPDSMKACLMQVCTEGYEAFELSQTTMERIKLHTSKIPDHMRRAVMILIKGGPREVDAHLPIVLGSIERVAGMCDEKSKEVVEKYESVRELIDELLSTGQSTKNHNEILCNTLKRERVNSDSEVSTESPRSLSSLSQTFGVIMGSRLRERFTNDPTFRKTLRDVEIAGLTNTIGSLEEIVDTLQVATRHLADLSERWRGLRGFFQRMAGLIDSATKPSMQFVEHARKMREDGVKMKDMEGDLIYSLARDAVTVGYVANRLATGYVEVSKDHLMDPVSRLPRLMVLDKDSDEAEIQRLMREIQEECKQANNALRTRVEPERRKFERELQMKRDAVREEFAPIFVIDSPTKVVKKWNSI